MDTTLGAGGMTNPLTKQFVFLPLLVLATPLALVVALAWRLLVARAHRGDNSPSFWNAHALPYAVFAALHAESFDRVSDRIADAVRGTDNVLEVGCGTGILTQRLVRVAKRVRATDFSSAMVHATHERMRGVDNVVVAEMDVFRMFDDPAVKPASYDAVVAANLLHLLPDVSRAVALLLRAAKPRKDSGKVVVPTFLHHQDAFASLLSWLLRVSGFPVTHSWTARTFQRDLKASGAEIVAFEIVDGLIPMAFATIQGAR